MPNDDDLLKGLWTVLCYGRWQLIAGTPRIFKHTKLEMTAEANYFDGRYAYEVRTPKWRSTFVLEVKEAESRQLHYEGVTYSICSGPTFIGDMAIITRDITYAKLLG